MEQTLSYDALFYIGSSVITLVMAATYVKFKQQDLDEKVKQNSKNLAELTTFMQNKRPMLDHFNKIENAFGKKIDEHSNGITTLKEKISQTISYKEV